MMRIVGVLLAVTCLSCSRKLVYEQTIPCRFELNETALQLAGKKWTETDIELRRLEKDSAYNEITGQFMESDLDDVMYFNSNGTYIFDEGKRKARPQSPQVYENGKWCLCENGNQLALISGPSVTIYDIVALSENVLQLRLLRIKGEKEEAYLLTYHVAE